MYRKRCVLVSGHGFPSEMAHLSACRILLHCLQLREGKRRRRAVRKAFDILLVLLSVLPLLLTVFSCDISSDVNVQEEVVICADIINELKSLNATFGDTISNNLTHFRWIMTHYDPYRIYDTGYVERSVAESGEMYANMDAGHRILTGRYSYVFSAYVNDGAGGTDENHHIISQTSESDIIVNRSTSRIPVVLDTLTGMNAGTEIMASLPLEYYLAYLSDGSRLTAETSLKNMYTGESTVFLSDPVITDVGANVVKISLPGLPSGSYLLKVTMTLDPGTQNEQAKSSVTVLRSVTDSIAKGVMNFASTSLAISAVGVRVEDRTGDMTAVPSIADFTVGGVDPDTNHNTRTADIDLSYDHTSDMEVKWYINGSEAGEGLITQGLTNGSVTAYTVQSGALTEGDNILSAVLMDRETLMGAGCVSFTVTVVAEDAELSVNVQVQGVPGSGSQAAFD